MNASSETIASFGAPHISIDAEAMYHLSAQLDKLSSAGYISIEKGMSGKRPRTTCSVTTAGRKAFEEYVDALRSYLNL